MEPEKLSEAEFYERVREVMAMYNQLRWLFLKADGKKLNLTLNRF